MTVSSSSHNPTSFGTDTSRTVSWVVNNGIANSAAATTTVSVTPVNDAPVVNAHGGSLAYTENQAATAIDTVLTVSDVDSATLAGATVSITSNFASAEDVLGFTSQNGITGSYNSTTGVLTLSGTSSVANYQTALASVTYFNSSDNPSGLTRTLSFQADDGSASNHLSNVATTTVSVTPVNDAPTLTATAVSPTFTEAAGLGTQAAAVSVFSGASASTIEAGQTIKGLSFTMGGLVDGANEKIVVDGTAITLGGNSSGTTAANAMAYTVTIASGTATIALSSAGGVSAGAINTLINGITYQDTNTDNPTASSRTFTLTQIQDSGGTANGGFDTTTLSIPSTVTVVPVNDAPVIASVSGSVSTNLNTPVTLVAATGTVTDVDAAPSDLLLATLSVAHGTLTPIGSVPGLTIVGGQDGSNGTLSFTGTQAAITQAIESGVTYTPTLNYNGPDQLTFTVNDQGHTGTGGAQTATATVGITVSADQAPVLSNVAPTASYTEQGAAVTLSSGATVSDVDNTTLASATVSITGGTFFTGDVLAATTAGTSITASYNAATGVLSLSGTDTLAHYQAVLDSVTYSSSSQNPTNFGADTSRSISWVVNDGTLNSTPATSTINITATDNAPVLSMWRRPRRIPSRLRR